MKKALSIILLASSLILTACGKDVDMGNTDDLAPKSPTPTTPVPKDPPAIIPPAANTGVLSTSFANHAEAGTSDELPSTYQSLETITLTIPSAPYNTTFNSNPHHPVLTLTVNDEYVCSYVWNGTQYVKHSSCFSQIILDPGAVITMIGIPPQQIVSMKFNYSK